MVIQLKYPATSGQRTIAELKLKDRPLVRDVMRTDDCRTDSVEADIKLLSALSGEPEKILENIDIDDWAIIRVELQKIWLRFFGINEKEVKEEDPQNAPEKAETPGAEQ